MQAGTVWMGYIAGTVCDLTQLRYDSLVGDLRWNLNPYASGATDPFGTANVSNIHYSLYATYTPSGTNQPPVPTITAPSSTLTWKVGDLINFSGLATDPQDGTLPAG